MAKQKIDPSILKGLRYIAKFFDASRSTVSKWRKRLGIPVPGYGKLEQPEERSCVDCGMPYLTEMVNAKRCPPCREIQHEIWYVSRVSRGDTGRMSRTQRRKFRKRISEEDGEEMAELVMDGMGTKKDRYSWEDED
jgi:hypothetical protein